MSITTSLIWLAVVNPAVTVNEHSQKVLVGGQPGDLLGVGVAISGDTAVVGATGVDVGGQSGAGAAYVYERSGASWNRVAVLTASTPVMGASFGWSVAIHDETIVVGAQNDPTAATDAGAVYVFVKPNGGWSNSVETARLTASDAAIEDFLGHSVAIDQDTVVAGARRSGAMDTGAVYLFVKPSGSWIDMTETAKLTASDAEPDDLFGRSVGISGDTVVIGTVNDGNSAVGVEDGHGSVYVFERPTAGWSDQTETAKLTASDAATTDYLGYSIDIDGDTIVAGALNDGNSGGAIDGIGSAYIFVKPVNGWVDTTQTAKLVYSNAEALGFFGWSVAIRNDRILVGAANRNHTPMMQDGQGSVYLFEKPDGGWNGNLLESGEHAASDAALLRVFGWWVDLSDDWFIVGSPGGGPGNNETGSAYFFSIDNDDDGVANHLDHCPDDAGKLDPGACGCGVADSDADGDGTPDCLDDCPNDANKTSAGVCGCGVADIDSDGDLIFDCIDGDPNDPNVGATGNGGNTPTEMEQCCGGGMPAMMPLMLLGWRRRKHRRLNRNAVNTQTIRH